ncbi:conserved hypothetical protein [Thioalkalivibrio sulfidiphilus HL-EbGr7]|uniref:Nitrogen regulatory protein P-II n=1 Tax=Thioalkalivibrio sulfidiphilus (strain HL-EbGR7) TaxID=396588 RepID=B8GN31_THISH|nr:hypothetical protein [Thioalkalivibrio sulfidiphilus]ACL71892.1 conserved hypothetical protein [Thioalkalivibrio sulfidiphilus HL-EbGr7]
MTKANLLIAVVSDQLEERAVAIIREEGGGGVTILPARGLNFPEHKSFFGLGYRGLEKILLCVLDATRAEHAVERLNRELDLLQPFQGLAFCFKLDETGGIDVAAIRRYLEAGAHKKSNDADPVGRGS